MKGPKKFYKTGTLSHPSGLNRMMPPKRGNEPTHRRFLTLEERSTVYSLWLCGRGVAWLARMYGCSRREIQLASARRPRTGVIYNPVVQLTNL